MTVHLEGGKSCSYEVSNYPGFATRPFTWEEIEAKFDDLTVGRADERLRSEIKAAVRSLENIPVSDLMRLLSHVNAPRPPSG